MRDLSLQDRYVVYCRSDLATLDFQVLTQLYQPILHPSALSLYMSLYFETVHHAALSVPASHYRLSMMMNIHVTELTDALNSLEALGLLKEFTNDDNEPVEVAYILKAPLKPQTFFKDELLSGLLLKTLGQDQFNRTIYQFKIARMPLTKYQDTTTHFADYYHVNFDTLEKADTTGLFKNDNEAKVDIQYDMEMVYRGLKDYQIPRSIFTDDHVNAISQLGILYHIAPSTMRELIYDVYHHQGALNIKDLREHCERYFEFEKHHQAEEKKEVKPVTRQGTLLEQKIQQFEQMHPLDYLTSKQNGASPTMRERRLVESALNQQKLSPGVVNVILETILVLDDGQLPKNHFEYLCGLFARKQVTTVKQAMQEAAAYMKASKKAPEVKSEVKVVQATTMKSDATQVDALRASIEQRLKKEELSSAQNSINKR